MPPEYYLGAAVGVVILVLLVLSFRPATFQRRVPSQSNDVAQLSVQLGRIADALEKLVAGTAPSGLERPAVVPAQTPESKVIPETKAADEAKVPESPAPQKHITLSMFG